MLRRSTPAANSCGVDVGSSQQPLSASPIGELKAVMGSVAISRANMLVGQAVAGSLIYQGDVIDTCADGSVTIWFGDGTRFPLHPGTIMVLDEFIGGADKPLGSALFRIVKGM